MNSGCTSSADKVEFTYDAEGRRTKVKTTPGGGSATTVTYRYQGGAVVEEKTGSTVTRQYVLDDSGAVVKMIIPSGQANAGTYLVTWNGHGDALALYRIFTTGTLQLANSFSYSTWGSPTTTTHNGYGDLGFRYLYIGRYGVGWDDYLGLGLYYMSARHYAPELGRFIQPDPSGKERNLYGYTAANPITQIDPSGTFAMIGDGGWYTSPVPPPPTPMPAPSPTPSPKPTPATTPWPTPSPMTTPTRRPSPTPSPSPTPMPMPAPGDFDAGRCLVGAFGGVLLLEGSTVVTVGGLVLIAGSVGISVGSLGTAAPVGAGGLVAGFMLEGIAATGYVTGAYTILRSCSFL